MADQPVQALFSKQRVITESSDQAKGLYDLGRFGTLKGKKVQLSLLEAAHLCEKGRVVIIDGRHQEVDFDRFVAKAERLEKNFWVRFCAYRDLRERGYIVKTALKFGADFRVYDRGVKPGEDHARWVVYPVHETEWLTWYEFSAKNRVAHSTRKRLLIACVDEEDDVTYWEVAWKRP